jgi:hypothetical protein
MSKRKRTRFIGAYRESPFQPIDLPFTVANLRALLSEGMDPDAHYTHQQIKDWAFQFWRARLEQPESLGVDVPPEVEKASELAQEVDMQWDMYLDNTYTLPELQRLDFSQVRMPHEWFAEWLARLQQEVPPAVAE